MPSTHVLMLETLHGRHLAHMRTDTLLRLMAALRAAMQRCEEELARRRPAHYAHISRRLAETAGRRSVFLVAVLAAGLLLAVSPAQATHRAELPIYLLGERTDIVEMPSEPCRLYAGLLNANTENTRYTAQCHRLDHKGAQAAPRTLRHRRASEKYPNGSNGRERRCKPNCASYPQECKR
jgi:hypothetical protein